ncbi:hypothetical protein GALMADRAFT_216010 [Galerina marginata CBS 339.88]|uniref:Pectate lyase n=1 Tax=Galerina marginata (strain CBS 339.88) TaxID=685588 RepID=A0A067SK64_GALM3|nr:hypothetical protein GALMADRAFT_216010 [Galerina marginata CBS 339.88]
MKLINRAAFVTFVFINQARAASVATDRQELVTRQLKKPSVVFNVAPVGKAQASIVASAVGAGCHISLYDGVDQTGGVLVRVDSSGVGHSNVKFRDCCRDCKTAFSHLSCNAWYNGNYKLAKEVI